jgi:hypothetical protein
MLVLYRVTHTSQVDWDMSGGSLANVVGIAIMEHLRCICNELTVWTEYRAREIQSLFDIQGKTGLLKRSAHLLRNTHESVAKDAELDGIYNQLLLFLVL